MCGRTACTLSPDDIQKACRYKQKDGKVNKPRWTASRNKYVPSYNKAPQSHCPVLLHGKHIEDNVETNDSDERKLAAMHWGLIPSWFKGGKSEKVNYSMNNARSSTLLEKRSYKVPLRKGQRCVVLADGFYEWNNTSQGKQPYYIYFPKSESSDLISEDSKEARKLLAMAGIFEKSFHGEEDVYSFTVITVDASSEFAWLHHRMPAMLETDEEIEAWLDFENVSLEEALKLIKPRNCLQWHPVSKFVNNSRNNSADCVKEVKVGSGGKLIGPSNSMLRWLKSGPVSRDPSTQSDNNKLSRDPSTQSDNNKSSVGAKRSCSLDKWVKKMKTET